MQLGFVSLKRFVWSVAVAGLFVQASQARAQSQGQGQTVCHDASSADGPIGSGPRAVGFQCL